MDPGRTLPATLKINAYTGAEGAQGALAERWRKWTLQNGPPRIRGFLRATPKANPRDWRDKRVGWGLVLPYNPKLSQAELATASDAPEPIQELVRARASDGQPAPVLRHIPESGHIGFLRRNGVDLPVNQSVYGTGSEEVPRYLLIYATPDQIPWEVQYSLNSSRCVGRLCLEGTQLENYVSALLDDWREGHADHRAALVWAADHGVDDITSLMRLAIAAPVAARLRSDPDIGAGTRYLDGSTPHAATATTLLGSLSELHPGFIVTTSHGMTGPLGNIELMRAQLGLPVDSDLALVQPQALLDQWNPGGAIWYAHACCSAGSDGRTLFDGLLEAGSPVDRLLKGVAECGARVAPLPTALLGAPDPLRAFVGHVEPTFNWTLEQQETGQFTTAPLVEALYEELFQPAPVGLALARLYGQLGGLYIDYERFLRVPSQPEMLYRLLVARDIQSTVILGDPTAILPL